MNYGGGKFMVVIWWWWICRSDHAPFDISNYIFSPPILYRDGPSPFGFHNPSCFTLTLLFLFPSMHWWKVLRNQYLEGSEMADGREWCWGSFEYFCTTHAIFLGLVFCLVLIDFFRFKIMARPILPTFRRNHPRTIIIQRKQFFIIKKVSPNIKTQIYRAVRWNLMLKNGCHWLLMVLIALFIFVFWVLRWSLANQGPAVSIFDGGPISNDLIRKNNCNATFFLITIYQ